MRTLAIGDIHGCNTALESLLARVQPQQDDRVVFLGDYIDRGPASCQVIETLLALKPKCDTVFLRGNHEVILDSREDSLKANNWHSYGGLETAFSYGARFGQNWEAAIPETHWTFFEQTARFFETNTHIFVHACLDPTLDMKDQPDWLIYWEFFDRLVQAHISGKRIICGHSVQSSGLINHLGFATCIDTGVAKGGWLTCLDVHSGEWWQANERAQTREGNL